MHELTEEQMARATWLYFMARHCAGLMLKDVVEKCSESISLSKRQINSIHEEILDLFLFWSTRFVWDYFSDDIPTIQAINDLLTFAFEEDFNINTDKRVFEYMRVSGTVEEVKKFGTDITDILDHKCAILHYELNITAMGYFKHYFSKVAKDAFKLPIENLYPIPQ